MEIDAATGRVPSEPGSRERSPEGLGPTGFDPSRELIPHGPYCYASLSPMDSQGRMKINGLCPYWERRGKEDAHCLFLDATDDLLLWDQVKICGISDDVGEENG